MNNYICQYYQSIKDGSVVAGKWINCFYKYVIDGLQNKSFFYDAKKAEKAITFITSYCRHHEGALAPQKINLELWQKAFLSVVFGIVDESGNRQFREVFLVIGRKNGKTLLAAAIAAYMAYFDGEYGARIYMCAPKLQQASLCFNAFYQMVCKDTALSKRAKKRRADIYIEETNTSVAPLPFSSKRSDGLNISCGICDETASWQGEQGLKFYEVLKSSQGSRLSPLLLSISTAGYQNNSIYDELMKRSTAVLNGTSKEKRFAPFLYMIDDINKWNDINELQKSNPNLGVSVSVDYLLEEIAVAEGSLSKRAEFITKYANVKQNSSQAWLPSSAIEKCFSNEELRLEDFRNSYAVVGIDLSQTTDLTSAIVIIEKNGVLNVIAHFWMPKERLEQATEEDGVPYPIFVEQGFLSLSGENFVDYTDVYSWVQSLVRNYKIMPLQIGYDRYSSNYLVQTLKDAGFHTDDVFQGTNLTGVIINTEGLLKDGKFNFGNNNLMKSHLYNSALQNETGGRMKLIKIGNRTRIDGTAALLDAMCMRQKYPELAVRLANKR